jgi:hypothetical protein
MAPIVRKLALAPPAKPASRAVRPVHIALIGLAALTVLSLCYSNIRAAIAIVLKSRPPQQKRQQKTPFHPTSPPEPPQQKQQQQQTSAKPLSPAAIASAAVQRHYKFPAPPSLDRTTHDLHPAASAPRLDTAHGVLPSRSWFARSVPTRLALRRTFRARSRRDGPLAKAGYKDMCKSDDGGVQPGCRATGIAGQPRLCAAEEGMDFAGQKCVLGLAPMLFQFANVFVDEHGRVLVPVEKNFYETNNGGKKAMLVDLYDVAGGCCETRDWPVAKKATYERIVTPSDVPRENLGLSLAQHHGATFHHAMHQVLPRLFAFWPLFDAAPDSMVIVVSGADVMPEMLTAGAKISASRIRAVNSKKPSLRFFEKLWVPGPYLQDPIAFPNRHHAITTPRILRDVIEAAADASGENSYTSASESALPTLVLMERASSRYGSKPSDMRCRGTRCMANFDDLRQQLVDEFTGLLDVQVLSATGSHLFETGVRLASRAKILVGMHGAGHRNIAFMKGAGTYVIHFGGNPMWRLYAALAAEFGVDFRNVWTDEATQDAVNIHVDVSVVLLEVWRILAADAPLKVVNTLNARRAERDRKRSFALNPSRSAAVVQVYDSLDQSESLLYDGENGTKNR